MCFVLRLRCDDCQMKRKIRESNWSVVPGHTLIKEHHPNVSLWDVLGLPLSCCRFRNNREDSMWKATKQLFCVSASPWVVSSAKTKKKYPNAGGKSTLANQCFYGHLNFMFFVIKILKSTGEENLCWNIINFEARFKSISHLTPLVSSWSCWSYGHNIHTTYFSLRIECSLVVESHSWHIVYCYLAHLTQ